MTLSERSLLTTALDELVLERQVLDRSYREIKLFDTTELCTGNKLSGPSNDIQTLPLYPLHAVYLPTNGNTTHTLYNTHPRNIRMALDILKQPKNDRIFCAVFSCADSGRWASIGTILRVVDAEPHHDADGSLIRITITCKAQPIPVEIMRIDNPDAANSKAKVLQSKEYIRGQVKPRVGFDGYSSTELASKIVNDYKAVRNFYINGIGSEQLPSFALDDLMNSLPEFDTNAVLNDFWEIAQVWQTLCYTLREGHQINLSSDRNELMVAAARKKGGPLQLPIHVSDLLPDDRKAVGKLEREAQQVWLDTRMDPTLDFLCLLVLPIQQRNELFASMISRERDRLTRLALFSRSGDALSGEEKRKLPRKGAWFE